MVMLPISVVAENSSRLLSRNLPEARLDDAVCIAQAIAQLMDPEWRELVDQEQHKRKAAPLSLLKG
jgi:hypothetical protein